MTTESSHRTALSVVSAKKFPLFHRIVVPVDGSPASDNAVGTAIAIAESLGSEIHFLFVVDSEKLLMDYRLQVGIDGAGKVIEDVSASGRRLLERVAERCRLANVRQTGTVLVGDVVDTILVNAAKFDADAIITATHGRRALESPHLGGRTQELLRRCTVPVLVVRLCS